MTTWSNDRARVLRQRMQRHVDAGALPGLVTLVADDDHANVDVIGLQSFDGTPMARDSIFRIASLSKPIAALAAMILVDDGTLQLDAPIDGLLPELANRRVLRSIDAELDDSVVAKGPITLHDVLTFRLGFGCIMAAPGTYPIQRAEEAMQLQTLGPPWPPTPHTNDEWIALLGSLPLMHQPGERWMYNTGSQVLGVLLERASGQPLEAFLRERLFAPLGMVDTGFAVPPNDLPRFTTAYAPHPDTGAPQVLDAPDTSYWRQPPLMPNAAGWLVSTIDDMWAFASMMWRGGVHQGRRIVSEASIELMTTDHLTAAQRADATLFLGDHSGWGFGMSVPAADGSTGVPGGYGWSGGTGTVWASDRTRGFTGILLSQRAMISPEPTDLFADFWDTVYQAHT